jgi:hypothetical protein
MNKEQGRRNVEGNSPGNVEQMNVEQRNVEVTAKSILNRNN